MLGTRSTALTASGVSSISAARVRPSDVRAAYDTVCRLVHKQQHVQVTQTCDESRLVSGAPAGRTARNTRNPHNQGQKLGDLKGTAWVSGFERWVGTHEWVPAGNQAGTPDGFIEDNE
ncbi:unnamed protein product [Lota lota]